MKNLLAENMLRFRAKNLSEPTKQKIVKLAEIISEQDIPSTTDVDITENKRFPLQNITLGNYGTGELFVQNTSTNAVDAWRVESYQENADKNGNKYASIRLTTYQPGSNKNTNLAKLGLIIYKDTIRIWPQHTNLNNAQYQLDTMALSTKKDPWILTTLQNPETYKNVPMIRQIQASL
jgi:hypothetical protein